MNKTYIFEGNTTNEAIEKGLKELKVSKNQVEIKVLEENKRSFFSILAPRIVKVEISLKENNIKEIKKEPKKEIIITDEELNEVKEFVSQYLNDFFEKINIRNIEKEMNFEENILKVNLKGEELKSLIGYRGDTLNSFETIINAMLKNKKYNIKVSCNINNFREKRITALNELADKVSKTVIKKGKSITLEPMPAYERKIIHTRLQNNEKVKTYSVGEGVRRRLIIALK